MLWKQVIVGNVEYTSVLGDTVWYFPQGQLCRTPTIGILQEINDDNMATITTIPNTESARVVRHTGVCLYGDGRLANPAVSVKGAWLPRGPHECLK